MLGVKGIILIVFIAIMGIQGFAISQYKKSSIAQKTEIAELRGIVEDKQSKIELQNKRIEESAKEATKLNEQLKTAASQNIVLNKRVKDMKVRLEKAPVPVTCPDSIAELKSTNNAIIIEWNAK
jgi:predicted nuclease with TOPRIM domain